VGPFDPLCLEMLIASVFLMSVDFMGTSYPSFSFVYILVAVDYVSKWVQGQATKTNDHKVMVKFVK